MTTATTTSPAAPHGGWYLLALADELTGPVTGLMLGGRALAVVRDRGRLRVFDGTCPHRGAHLGHGGKVVDGRVIICPFHGKRIGLGEGDGRLRVREHEVLDCGDALFVRLADTVRADHGFERAMKELIATHVISSAVTGPVSVPPEIIIENAFDIDHFAAVHLVPRLVGLRVETGDDGELTITTGFRTRVPPWETGGGEVTTRFFARAFSPSLVVTELGPHPGRHVVFTGATPASGGCIARIAIAVRRGSPPATADALIAGARQAFDQDLRVWQHLDTDAPACLDSRDAPVLAFRAFCAGFTATGE